jgi:uncharacterized membrane-anchored protein
VLVGSKVLSGGEVYCDWLVHDDHFSRFLVLDLGFREAQAGRLIQRLFEIETYRMMALLALPDARRHSQFLGKLDGSLSVLMRRMEEPVVDHDDAYLLRELTRLAGQIEAHAGLETRFSASEAYEKLVLARIAELREERIEGFPTIAEFMQRRLLPAMQTCSSVWARHQQFATRVARAVDLLRTRVNLMQEEHTTALLEGMNRTARTQLRMQHAVEGLSVAAISTMSSISRGRRYGRCTRRICRWIPRSSKAFLSSPSWRRWCSLRGEFASSGMRMLSGVER